MVGIVCLVIFGPDKLPELAKSLGELTAQLRKASDTLRRDFYRELYPPLPDNPLTQAKRELQAVSNDVKATFTGSGIAYGPPSTDRLTHCEAGGQGEAGKNGEGNRPSVVTEQPRLTEESKKDTPNV